MYIHNLSVFVCVLQLGSPFGQLETYKKLEALGEGSYATVYKVRICKTMKAQKYRTCSAQ